MRHNVNDWRRVCCNERVVEGCLEIFKKQSDPRRARSSSGNWATVAWPGPSLARQPGASLPQMDGAWGTEYFALRLSRNCSMHGPCRLALVPAFRLFFHPPAAAVAQSRARQSAHDPRILVPRDLLSLTPDSPDRLGGESLNIPQGGSQPWNMTMSCAASFSGHSSPWSRKDIKKVRLIFAQPIVCPITLMCHPSCTVIKACFHRL